MTSLSPRSALSAIAFVALAAACNKQPEPISDKPSTTSASNPGNAHSTPTPGAGNAESAHGSNAAHGGAMPTGNAGPGGNAGAAAGPQDLAYDAPSTWTSAPNPNTMRKATFKIPKVAGDTEDAELAVSVAAGGVDANIKRWEQQFGDAKAKTEPRNVNGLKVTVVEIRGKFAGGGMMGQPSPAKDNQMLLGAVVDAGESQHFFKLIGPEKTVTAARKDFDKFVGSFRAK